MIFLLAGMVGHYFMVDVARCDICFRSWSRCCAVLPTFGSPASNLMPVVCITSHRCDSAAWQLLIILNYNAAALWRRLLQSLRNSRHQIHASTHENKYSRWPIRWLQLSDKSRRNCAPASVCNSKCYACNSKCYFIHGWTISVVYRFLYCVRLVAWSISLDRDPGTS